MKKFTSLILIAIWVYLCFFPLLPAPNALHLWVLNVGQGQSVFIQTPEKIQILFDGGPDSTVLNELGQIMPPWDREIDLIITSHNHSDHIRGLIQVIKRYKINEIWESGSFINSADYNAYKQEINQKKIKTKTFNSNSPPIQIGSLKFQCLYPVQDVIQKNPKNPHLANLVFKITYDQQNILLTGDLNLEHINEMIQACQKKVDCSFSSQLFQVPHHGSATGLTNNFLNLINPKIAFISVGANNKLGHPNPKSLALLEEKNIKTLRTDLNKRIHFVLKNGQITLLGINYK